MGFLNARDIQGLTATLGLVANAKLTQIFDTPTMDSSGRKTVTGPALWTGSVPAYLDREQTVDELGGPTSRNDVFAAGMQTVVNVDTLTILDAAGAPLLERPGTEWEGTTIRVEDDRTAPATVWEFLVHKMSHDFAGTLDSITLELAQPRRIS